ncbi:MAG: D-sedoheptulose 7-phosphate isomerase [Caldilineaceae bacterium]
MLADLSAIIKEGFQDDIAIKQRILSEQLSILNMIAQELLRALDLGKKIIVFGNGGSAADSQHIAGELVGKFSKVRRALPCIALTTDSAILTSISNDFGYAHVFARQLEALGSPGDVVLGISTSGNSENVVRGLETAAAMELTTIGFTGRDGGQIERIVDLCFCVPSYQTPRIQEAHMAVAHAMCEFIENRIATFDYPQLGGQMQIKVRN